jgi:hypothetical protein
MKTFQEKLEKPQLLVAKLLRGKRTSEYVKKILRDNDTNSEVVQDILNNFVYTGNYP